MARKSDVSEIILKINAQALGALEQFLYIRKITDNVIGPDYDFAVFIVKAIKEGRKEIQIFVGKKS